MPRRAAGPPRPDGRRWRAAILVGLVLAVASISQAAFAQSADPDGRPVDGQHRATGAADPPPGAVATAGAAQSGDWDHLLDRLEAKLGAKVTPNSVMRLQLRPPAGDDPGLSFEDVKALAPMLKRLGIRWVYLSPSTKAVDPASAHGYNVGDYLELSRHLGGQAAFEALAEELVRLDLGVLLDWVPNHMGAWSEGDAGPDNGWWWSVLKFGPESVVAGVFDIDWDAPGMGGKLLATRRAGGAGHPGAGCARAPAAAQAWSAAPSGR